MGKWDAWYRHLSPITTCTKPYGDAVTYLMAAAFLADVEEVEDWGCGAGGFRHFCLGRYMGLDGSKTPFADKIVDLCSYGSRVAGINMRHVLEHNYDWESVLAGAVQSFQRKLCLVLFTPFVEETKEIAHNRASGADVPDLSFNRADIERHFEGLMWRLIPNIKTKSQYGVEHVYLVWRR
jgi:hypothetical protein